MHRFGSRKQASWACRARWCHPQKTLLLLVHPLLQCRSHPRLVLHSLHRTHRQQRLDQMMLVLVLVLVLVLE
jgi:hypothetical protein